MAKQINAGVGVVKTIKEVPLGIGGVVKKAKKGVCGVGGVVKEFFVSDLVLWNGSSVQNGASLAGTKGVAYSGDISALIGKSLVLKVKGTYNNIYYFKIQITLSNGVSIWCIGSDGYVGTSSSKAKSTWTSGTEYVIDLSATDDYMPSGTKLTFTFNENSSNQVIADFVQYIAFR